MNASQSLQHKQQQQLQQGALVVSIGVGITASILLWIWVHQKSGNGKGPKKWPLVGCYFEVVRNFPTLHDWILSYFSADCKTYAIDWVTEYNYVTVDPANVEYMLKTNFPNYPKGELFSSRKYDLMGDGIFNSDGDMWRRHRKLASYEFSSRKLRDFSALVFKKYAVQMMEVLNKSVNQQIDFQDICMRMTLDSICEVGFGVEMGFLGSTQPSIPFAYAFDRSNELIVKRSIGPIWKLRRALNIGVEKELKKHLHELDTFTYKVIEKRRSEIEDAKKSGRVCDKEDLLSRFMMAPPQDNEAGQADKELRDAILNFIIAGRDTTAITLSWFIYCICNNPEVSNKIRSELENVLGADAVHNCSSFEEFAELLTNESLNNLHYLHAALTETLRLYPAVPRDAKTVLKDDVLPDGTKVKSGNTLAYIPYSMGRMEFLWGQDALEFKPERWIKDSVFQPESPFKFTAFQAGPRICLGKDSAYMSMKITAAMLVRFFDFKLVEGQVVTYRMLMVLAMLNGIQLTLTPNP